ncbi:MAG: type II toxin-antitoxin system PemK/MazF family toxin [Dyadobacter sp.]|uniref:type II toxin-antitoxin system PemK/MazF family toxin n=1 Tax=Dyadobacter sp. TaxID=1914288 RepID=UPI001B2380F9|nr:type II toxin-antitoxin system PemK/MazF family toxin [Dyadobacter sp.]MBO9614183.1 type II toxin-antitoxin system PemK/MazF family toxin [Dyadobacter sp.]
MAKFVKGEVVVIPFPFSDLSGSKRRPALVLANLPGDDLLLCQITSQNSRDIYAIPLLKADFLNGSLPVDSFIRPTRLFTADGNIVIRKAGLVGIKTINDVTQTIIRIIQ